MLGSRRLRQVSARFEGAPDLPWMLAAGAVIGAYREMTARVDPLLSALDLTMPRYEILARLAYAPDGCDSVRNLKRWTLLHPPTMTYSIDWLCDRELVTRQQSSADRRSVLVSITPKGRALSARADAALGAIRFGLDGIERDDALAIVDALARTQQQ
jgi:DNA-binding MarR family transcriptional regulator